MKRLLVSLIVVVLGGGAYAAQLSSSSSLSMAKATESKEAMTSVVASTPMDEKAECPVFCKSSAGDRACLYWQMACNPDLDQKLSVEAQFRWACCLDAGNGVERNEQQAFCWFNEAGATGDISSLLAVAACYELGLGVEKNLFEAMRRYRLIDLMFQRQQKRLAKKKSGQTVNVPRLTPACFALERVYNQLAKLELEKDPRKACFYRESAADYGHAGTAGLNSSPNYLGFWEREPKLFWCICEEKQPVQAAVQDLAPYPLRYPVTLADSSIDCAAICGIFSTFQ